MIIYLKKEIRMQNMQNIGSNSNDRTPFSFLPSSYFSQVKARINVEDSTSEQIREVMKTATIIEQEVILHDLLVAGTEMKNQGQTERLILAAQLYVDANIEAQRDFLMYLMQVRDIFKIFTDTMTANSIINGTIEREEPGSSGFCQNYLYSEQVFAQKFNSLFKAIRFPSSK